MEENLSPPQDKIVFLVLNPDIELFKPIFTKLEVTTAFEFISKVINESGIPFLIASRKKGELTGDSRMETLGTIQERTATSQFVSKYDEEFQERYSTALENMVGKRYTYQGLDPFTSQPVISALRRFERSNVMICGTPIELDCLASVFGAIRTGYSPFIVSDACSSPSERLYYEALDVISRIASMIDTRDMMKSWGMV